MSLPVIPTAVISLHTDSKQKPLTHTSIGTSQVCQSFSLQISRSCVYLSFSHDTVSSMTISFLPVLDQSTVSGRRAVWTISGKTSLYLKSTTMFQPVVSTRINEPTLRFCNIGCVVCFLLVSPDLTNAIYPCWGLLPGSFFGSFSSQSASYPRTESCLHLFLP